MNSPVPMPLYSLDADDEESGGLISVALIDLVFVLFVAMVISRVVKEPDDVSHAINPPVVDSSSSTATPSGIRIGATETGYLFDGVTYTDPAAVVTAVRRTRNTGDQPLKLSLVFDSAATVQMLASLMTELRDEPGVQVDLVFRKSKQP